MKLQHHANSEALLLLIKGEENGLQVFFEQYYTPLVFYSASVVSTKEIAKEIASEAFIKLWNMRTTLEVGFNIKSLLYRMVYNASIDYVREQKTAVKRAKTYQAINITKEKPVLDKLIETETYRRLYQLLATLSPRARQIFHMFYFQKKAIKEIAAQLGVSVNTVKTQKLRALQTLRHHQGSL